MSVENMDSVPEQLHSPPTNASKRPKGILKNRNSYQAGQSDDGDIISPLAEQQDPMSPRRPSMPNNRTMSEKEIVQMNTEMNAGAAHARRPSSAARSSFSRRQSTDLAHDPNDKSGSPRLQWDEANLFLNEGQMGGKMKIDEPKTPFVYGVDGDPMAEDDEPESSAIDPHQIVVDELDKAKVMDAEASPVQRRRENDIPDLDIGEPEREVSMERRPSDGEKRVVVAPEIVNAMDIDDTGRHGEGNEEDMGADEIAKHKKFEEMRKKHYEMSNVRDLLGHVEDEDE